MRSTTWIATTSSAALDRLARTNGVRVVVFPGELVDIGTREAPAQAGELLD